MTDADNNLSRIFALGRLSIEEANNSRLEAVYPPGYHHCFYICLMPLDNTGHLVELSADDITGMAGTALNIIKYYDDPGSSEGVSGETDPFFTACYSFGTADDNLFQYVGHFTRNNLLYIKVRTNAVPSTAHYYEGYTLAVSFENTNGRWACNHNSGSGFDSSISFYQPPLPAPAPTEPWPDGRKVAFYSEQNYQGDVVMILTSDFNPKGENNPPFNIEFKSWKEITPAGLEPGDYSCQELIAPLYKHANYFGSYCEPGRNESSGREQVYKLGWLIFNGN